MHRTRKNDSLSLSLLTHEYESTPRTEIALDKKKPTLHSYGCLYARMYLFICMYACMHSCLNRNTAFIGSNPLPFDMHMYFIQDTSCYDLKPCNKLRHMLRTILRSRQRVASLTEGRDGSPTRKETSLQGISMHQLQQATSRLFIDQSFPRKPRWDPAVLH